MVRLHRDRAHQQLKCSGRLRRRSGGFGEGISSANQRLVNIELAVAKLGIADRPGLPGTYLVPG